MRDENALIKDLLNLEVDVSLRQRDGRQCVA